MCDFKKSQKRDIELFNTLRCSPVLDPTRATFYSLSIYICMVKTEAGLGSRTTEYKTHVSTYKVAIQETSTFMVEEATRLLRCSNINNVIFYHLEEDSVLHVCVSCVSCNSR